MIPSCSLHIHTCIICIVLFANPLSACVQVRVMKKSIALGQYPTQTTGPKFYGNLSSLNSNLTKLTTMYLYSIDTMFLTPSLYYAILIVCTCVHVHVCRSIQGISLAVHWHLQNEQWMESAWPSRKESSLALWEWMVRGTLLVQLACTYLRINMLIV